MYACMYMSICNLCMHACMYVYVYDYYVCVQCMFVCMYVCMYVCRYVCFMMRRMCFDDILNIGITSIVAFTNLCATADDIRTVHSISRPTYVCTMYIIMYACICVGIYA